MEKILLNISLVAVLTALFRMLAPEKMFKKQISLLISCFFITSAAFFITGGSFDFSGISKAFTANGGYVDFSNQYSQQTKREIASAMSDRVTALLDSYGIAPRQIYITVNISDTLCISISEIRLVFDSESSRIAEQAQQIVKAEVGDEIEVSIEYI
ncbi:MAG: hypothetical protein ACI4J1_10950 [Ruminiclostridium sp.]